MAQLEQRLGALEGVRGELGTLGGRLQALAPLEGRVQALETKPAPAMPDLRPLEGQVASLAERAAVAERSAAQATDRSRRTSAGCRGSRPSPPSTRPRVAPRAAFDALGTRVEAQAARIQQIDTDLGRRLQEVAKADEQREQAAQQAMQQKLAELGRADEEREKAAQQAATQKLQALETDARPAHRRAGDGAEADGGPREPHRAARGDRPAARRAARRPAAGRGPGAG